MHVVVASCRVMGDLVWTLAGFRGRIGRADAGALLVLVHVYPKADNEAVSPLLDICRWPAAQLPHRRPPPAQFDRQCDDAFTQSGPFLLFVFPGK